NGLSNGNNENALRLAKEFDRKWFYQMLSNNYDDLGYYSLNAKNELLCVEGLLEEYHRIGDSSYIKCTENFINWVRESHELPTNGVAGKSAYSICKKSNYNFFEYPNMLFKHISGPTGNGHCSSELNLICSKLFSVTKNLSLMDDFELRFINAILP